MPGGPWRTIPELVDDAARRFPDAEALVEDGDRWTFTDLAGHIHRAARALMASGMQSGDRIAVWAPNIREWVVAALAVHRCRVRSSSSTRCRSMRAARC